MEWEGGREGGRVYIEVGVMRKDMSKVHIFSLVSHQSSHMLHPFQNSPPLSSYPLAIHWIVSLMLHFAHFLGIKRIIN